MRVQPAAEAQIEALSELAAVCQSDPQRHIAYVGVSATVIAAEIGDVDNWTDRTWTAWSGDRVVGWLLGETDPDLGRVWWWGPFVEHGSAWDQAADLLYHAAASGLAYPQEEVVSDSRSTILAAFAERHGFHREEGSALLSLRDVSARRERHHVIRPMEESDREPVGIIHDELFPGTHTTGDRLVSLADGRRAILVARTERGIAGYVATELQHDQSLYIDFLGVDPSARRRGLGSALVTAAIQEGLSRGATWVHLSVRESNDPARALYRSLGFVEDRVLHPHRKGFSLA